MQKRWQDSAGLVLGILLFLSPWIVGFSAITAAAASAWAIGAATVVLFAVALFVRDFRLEAEWVNLVLAVALLIAPVALGFATVPGAAVTHWLIGVLIGADAGWALLNLHGRIRGTT